MVVLESSRFGIREEKERICNKRMGSDEKSKVGFIEDGETSDLESVKSIGRDDLKASKQPPKSISPPIATAASKATPMMTTMTTTASSTASAPADSSNKYWMKDLYNYSYARGYSASGLYSLAWAQAVQNKPLNDVLGEFKQEEGGDEQRGASVSSSAIGSNEQSISFSSNGDDSHGNKDVIDDEREEGELEEGEIDLDSELIQVEEGDLCGRFSNNGMEDEEELEDRVPLIRKVLENVNATEAEKSFDVVCARLRGSVESLQQLVLHCWFPSKDALIEQSFMGFKCVNSVYLAMSPMQREQNKSAMTRLLTYVTGLQPALFSPEQMKEIESMMVAISLDGSQRSSIGDKQEEPVTDKAVFTDSNTLAVNQLESFKQFERDPSSSLFNISDTSKKVEMFSSDKKGVNMSEAVRLLNLPSIKTKMGIGPLLDVDKIHHLEDLPSPTGKDPPPHPLSQMVPVRKFAHPYEKDAVKAVTSYQQKFAHRTFLSSDRLPSPTPSEEGENGEVNDVNEEVSSYSAIPSVSQPVFPPQVDSSAYNIASLAMQRLISSATVGLRGPAVCPPQATAKSRDPRLRYMKPDLNPSDSPAMKKQKNGPEVTGIVAGKKEVQSVFGTTGLQNSSSAPAGNLVSRGLTGASVTGPRKADYTDPRKVDYADPQRVDNADPRKMDNADPRKIENVAAIGSGSIPMNTSTSITLQSLLRDIAGNPAAWINIFEEQRKSSEPSKAAPYLVNSASTQHPMPFSSVDSAKSSMMVQQTGGLAQLPSSVVQTNLQDKFAKVRMKARDPRRVLYTSSTESSGNSASNSGKPDDVVTAAKHAAKESLDPQKHVNGTDTSALPSRSSALPDITRQFTKSLKNIADMVSVSRAPAEPSLNSQGSSEGGQAHSGASAASGNIQDEPNVNPEEVASGPAQSWTTWRDVEHLFDGYDEKQKAAIQKERARRIEEQKKMFSSRKLCLVLDLDHTLLNSAKFSEVDPIHNEILRKKEEQDREKPYKHLFCFPHMQMWTKLRPGIWNFLEKASKLFEMHLYTMGNKLYATEMAKVLDPKGVLFAGRVISRGDDGDPIDGDERVPKSKDLEGVLGMESAVVIIDDSVKVWPHNKPNLIVYIFSIRQFGLPGPSLLEIDHDERAEDGTLAASLSVIERLHRNFFSNERLDDVDVRNILAFEQRKILAGCKIVFSRVFPVGEVNPHLHPLWQTAEQFGAICTNQIDEQVTHVVANSLGTDKVNWAHAKGRFVVHPGWVEASALLYRRANELDFAIKS
ncbi:LOW QUALITY PROTEIN: hypothetical protein V2J09_001639 [Rumex salicifolius]